MVRIPYIPPTPVPIRIGIITIDFELHDLQIQLTNEYMRKLTEALSQVKEKTPLFLIFPEYSYDDKLFLIYQDFSNSNKCIVIGGSKLFSVNNAHNNFYSACPIFFPDREMILVGKEDPTQAEIQLSNGTIVPYPNANTRDFTYLITYQKDEIDIRFSVFICKDFLMKHHSYFGDQSMRKDIFFVPQYEPKPGLFISSAVSLSTEMETYVCGVNKSNHNSNNQVETLRSIGTGSLNGSSVQNLATLQYRDLTYNSNFDRSIIYDVQGQVALVLEIDLGNPTPPPHTRSRVRPRPNVTPIFKRVQF